MNSVSDAWTGSTVPAFQLFADTRIFSVLIVGNTPADYASNLGRPDLLGRLIVRGADISIENKAGLTAYDVTEFDRKDRPSANDAAELNPAAAASAASSASASASPAAAAAGSSRKKNQHRLTPNFIPPPPKPRQSIEVNYPVQLGTRYRLLVDRNQYCNESDRAACKRILFQHRLLLATNADPYGDAARVRQLVNEWTAAYNSDSYEMFPLNYRGQSTIQLEYMN